MRQKKRLPVMVIVMLTCLLMMTGLFTRNVIGKLVAPEVTVIPSNTTLDEPVLVEAEINVDVC